MPNEAEQMMRLLSSARRGYDSLMLFEFSQERINLASTLATDSILYLVIPLLSHQIQQIEAPRLVRAPQTSQVQNLRSTYRESRRDPVPVTSLDRDIAICIFRPCSHGGLNGGATTASHSRKSAQPRSNWRGQDQKHLSPLARHLGRVSRGPQGP